jgi:DNA replication protein DnaC
MSAASLPILLRSLNLATMAREHEAALARAEAEDWGYARFLRHLVETEANERLRRRVERLLKESHLPASKTLASVDSAHLPDKVRRQLPTLLTGDFIRRGDNLLCFGLPGRGKTLFLAALCRELVQQHQLPILYTTAHRLVTELLIAKRDLKLERLIAKFERFAAIAIDDLGYTQQSREEMEVLFTLLAERYEKKSVFITSNLVFSQWDQIFKDPMMTMAAVDRLVHHAIILEFNGRSYRADQADAAKAKSKS